MSSIDPHDRTDLTGPWVGFGFQGGHMFTPEGHSLEPGDIAREWRLMMAEARPPRDAPARPKAQPLGRNDSSVIHLRAAIRARQERRLPGNDPGLAAEPPNLVHLRCGTKSRQRG